MTATGGIVDVIICSAVPHARMQNGKKREANLLRDGIWQGRNAAWHALQARLQRCLIHACKVPGGHGAEELSVSVHCRVVAR